MDNLGYKATKWQIKALEILNREVKKPEFQKAINQSYVDLMIDGVSYQQVTWSDDNGLHIDRIIIDDRLE